MESHLTGGQMVVECLKQLGVRHVFGLIGSATMEIFDALYQSKKEIEFIGVRDERTGTHMADGYARSTGKPGVILAGQNGPGATNLVTGLAQANAAYSPVIALAGSLSSGHVYRDAFQEVDQQSLFTPITKRTWTVNQTGRIPEMLDEAFRVALSPRRGPVLLNFPRDVLSKTENFKSFFSQAGTPKHQHGEHFPAGSQDEILRATALLQKAKKPLIVAGGGFKVNGDNKSLIGLAEKLNIPVATSPGHGDVFPYHHPLNAGQTGPRGNQVASRLLKEADVILAIGTRLGFNTTFYTYDNLNPEASIIQVEIEPTAIGRFFPVVVGIWGDAPTICTQITECTSQRLSEEHSEEESRGHYNEYVSNFQQERSDYLRKRDEEAVEGEPIQPSGLFKVLRKVLPDDTAVTLDAGTLCLQATDALNFTQPRSLFSPLDFGLVGFSFACGLGIKIANPNRTVVSLMGDGGFGMTVSELSTAVQHGINSVTIVMNNDCWGAEKAYQRDFFGRRYLGADLTNPPFDQLAELYGAVGFKVEQLSELASAVEEALNCGRPAVVNVMVDPKALYSFRRDSFQHRIDNSK